MNKLYKTNFKTLETEFKDIIKSIRETDSTGEISTSLITRKTYILINKKKLYVTEFTSKNVIKKYYYHLYDENNKVIMKFHSEPHNDKRYQTSTEPFHIHGNENSKLTNEKRFPNYNFKSLWDIMEFLRLMIIYFDEMPHY